MKANLKGYKVEPEAAVYITAIVEHTVGDLLDLCVALLSGRTVRILGEDVKKAIHAKNDAYFSIFSAILRNVSAKRRRCTQPKKRKARTTKPKRAGRRRK